MNNIDIKAALAGSPRCAATQRPHVGAEILRQSRHGTPGGEYQVDAEALRRARQGTPTGEYHWLELQGDDGFHRGSFSAPYPPERCSNCGGFHPPEHCRLVQSVH